SCCVPVFRIIVLRSLLGMASPSLGQSAAEYVVVGGVTSEQPGEGIVLMKSVAGGRAFPARVGEGITGGGLVVRAARQFVYLRLGQRTVKVRVGEDVDFNGPVLSVNTGIERHGSKVSVSASLRDEIVNPSLSKVLMQAAAVPHYENGSLIGFRLWD